MSKIEWVSYIKNFYLWFKIIKLFKKADPNSFWIFIWTMQSKLKKANRFMNLNRKLSAFVLLIRIMQQLKLSFIYKIWMWNFKRIYFYIESSIFDLLDVFINLEKRIIMECTFLVLK